MPQRILNKNLTDVNFPRKYNARKITAKKQILKISFFKIMDEISNLLTLQRKTFGIGEALTSHETYIGKMIIVFPFMSNKQNIELVPKFKRNIAVQTKCGNICFGVKAFLNIKIRPKS